MNAPRTYFASLAYIRKFISDLKGCAMVQVESHSPVTKKARFRSPTSLL